MREGWTGFCRPRSGCPQRERSKRLQCEKAALRQRILQARGRVTERGLELATSTVNARVLGLLLSRVDSTTGMFSGVRGGRSAEAAVPSIAGAAQLVERRAASVREHVEVQPAGFERLPRYRRHRLRRWRPPDHKHVAAAHNLGLAARIDHECGALVKADPGEFGAQRPHQQQMSEALPLSEVRLDSEARHPAEAGPDLEDRLLIHRHPGLGAWWAFVQPPHAAPPGRSPGR